MYSLGWFVCVSLEDGGGKGKGQRLLWGVGGQEGEGDSVCMCRERERRVIVCGVCILLNVQTYTTIPTIIFRTFL